jgi:hypothetical protein
MVQTIEKSTAICNTTKSGYPALWECGGATTKGGFARVICGPGFEKKKAIFVRTGGELSNGDHALFVVEKGDHLVQVKRQNEEIEIEIFRISGWCKDLHGNHIADLDLINRYDMGEWTNPVSPQMADAVFAAISKAKHYHCREMYFGISPEPII